MKKISKLLIVLAFVLSLILVIYMFKTGYSIKVRHITMEFKDLPSSFDGTKIALAADMHVGLFISEEYIKKVSAMIMEEKPDIIAFLGDYVYSAPRWFHYYNPKNVEELKNAISNLKAPLGMYAVMGNHDNWEAPSDISNALYNTGFKLIDNNIVYITNKSNDYISIGGVGDYITDDVNFEAASIGVGTNDFHIVLSHEPKGPLRKAEKEGYIDLADFLVSGHTHGGQISHFPMSFIEKLNTNRKYPRLTTYGIMNYKNTKVYITSGVGMVLLPFRLFATPEIVIVTLKSKE